MCQGVMDHVWWMKSHLKGYFEFLLGFNVLYQILQRFGELCAGFSFDFHCTKENIYKDRLSSVSNNSALTSETAQSKTMNHVKYDVADDYQILRDSTNIIPLLFLPLQCSVWKWPRSGSLSDGWCRAVVSAARRRWSRCWTTPTAACSRSQRKSSALRELWRSSTSMPTRLKNYPR